MDPAHKALVTEVKLACAAGVLICLDRAHRLTYILGAGSCHDIAKDVTAERT